MTLVLLGLVLGGCASVAEVEERRKAEPPAPPEEAPEPEPPDPPPPPRDAEPAGSPCDHPETDVVPMLDDARELIHETLCGAALWLDGIFGDPGDIAAARRTHGRVEVSTYYSDFDGGAKTRVRLNARVDLPAFKRRLSAFVGLDDEDRFIQDRSEGFALRSQFPQLEDQDEWLAGLGYALPGNERFRMDFRVGARRLTNTRVFVQNRYRYAAYADARNLLYLRSTLFWTNQDGLGITSGVDFSHVIDPTRLVRWDTVGTYSQETLGVNWRTAVIDYHHLGKKRAIAYEAFVRGETDHPEPLGEFGLRTIYRQPLFRERLFAELLLGYSWPRDDPALPRKGSLGAGIGFELPFGPGAAD